MASKVTQIKSITYGATAIAGNMTVAWDDGVDNIIRNKFDDALYATGAKATAASTTGTISGIDFREVQSLTMGGSDSLVFVGIDVSTGTDVTVTIVNTMLLKPSGSIEHDGDGSSSLTFEAFSADGDTSPVSVVTAP